MDPRIAGEVVSSCFALGGVIWLTVVICASGAGIAVLVESLRS